jgi:hypothetical protein
MKKAPQPLQIKTDPNGLVTLPSLHDAELTGVRLIKRGTEKRLLLRLVTESGKRFKVVLHDVVIVKCREFSLQNVVLDIHYISGMDLGVHTDALRQELGPAAEPQLKRLAADVASGRRAFFQITPSVGCEVVCLCKKAVAFACS